MNQVATTERKLSNIDIVLTEALVTLQDRAKLESDPKFDGDFTVFDPELHKTVRDSLVSGTPSTQLLDLYDEAAPDIKVIAQKQNLLNFTHSDTDFSMKETYRNLLERTVGKTEADNRMKLLESAMKEAKTALGGSSVSQKSDGIDPTEHPIDYIKAKASEGVDAAKAKIKGLWEDMAGKDGEDGMAATLYGAAKDGLKKIGLDLDTTGGKLGAAAAGIGTAVVLSKLLGTAKGFMSAGVLGTLANPMASMGNILGAVFSSLMTVFVVALIALACNALFNDKDKGLAKNENGSEQDPEKSAHDVNGIDFADFASPARA